MKVVLDEGLIITGGQLKVDVEATRKNIEQSSSEAFALTLTIVYPTNENINALLQIAHKEAYALALNATVPTKETIEDIIRKAHTQMLSLNTKTENTKPAE
jgi:large subunit ribosomal protein L10